MTSETRFAYLKGQAEAIAQSGPPQNPHLHRLPALFFLTDPARIDKPEDIVRRLPQGCGVIYRHFGDPGAVSKARFLKEIAGLRGLKLLIGEDLGLCLEIGADGVHLKETSLGRAAAIRSDYPDLILTGARHKAENLGGSDEEGLDGLFISPVFASQSASASGVAPLGLAGVRAFADRAQLPLLGLGGISTDNITRLIGSGLSGIGAIDAFRHDV